MAHALVESTEIGVHVEVGEFSIVRRGAVIEDDVVIHPHVVVNAGVRIGAGSELFPGTVVGKAPKGAGATARTPHFERRVDLGAECSVGPNAVVFYDVVVGPHTLLGDGASIREGGRIADRCILSRCTTLNYDVTIGSRTKVMDLSHITGRTTIGNDVFISVGVMSTNDNAMGAEGFTDAVIGPTIDDEAMIGAGAILLPAIRIGRAATVGAGAVVTRDVAPGTTVMGVPARVVGRTKRRSTHNGR